jgi:hypothetical protein
MIAFSIIIFDIYARYRHLKGGIIRCFFFNHVNNYEPSLSNKFNNILAIDKGPCIDDPCVQQQIRYDYKDNTQLLFKMKEEFQIQGNS